MGYYLGLAKFEKKQNVKLLLLLSVSIPIVLHGMYDFIIIAADKYIHIIIVPFMFFLWWFALHKVKLAGQG